jgi:GDP-L-fucose synthase
MEVWGSGTPMREFLYSDDMAEACVHLLNLGQEPFSRLLSADVPPLVNIGVGQDMSIRELAETVCRVVGFEGELVFDRSKPDGTPRKLLDIGRLTSMGWTARTGFEQGLAQAYADFLRMAPDTEK